MKNKSILITGGTGSLGKALIKRLKKSNKIIIYSRDEGKQALMFGNNPEIIRVIGDVRDYNKLNVTLQRHKVDYIIHTAALKRIDDMEWHPDECIKTNINGSENVARAALSNGVKKCILVSTDKACQPVNVYGSSKFIAERIFTNYDYHSTNTIFASVRYGNVIASRGSFVPLFMDWIKRGQKIKVTSEEMTRFLFTLDDAVDAVLGALENSQGGEVFVPQINSYTLPVCIEALEKIVNKKSNTEIMGLRPGEKLHEDMLAETELPFTFQVPNINLLQIRPQYTTKTYQNWEKYTGPHFNSELWVKKDINELIDLINKGLDC
jgi:FlaA1/EpsC-like NDP-sugar epimerase|tara:strand:+ start:1803 stop:2768 length:966 start_codon:yes stop_codon:yes gene_type:complete